MSQRHFLWNVALPIRLAMVAVYGTKALSLPVTPRPLLRRGFSGKSIIMGSKGLHDFGLTAENSFVKFLNAEDSEGKPQHVPRQVYKSHFTHVAPEPVPTPYMIAASESCAKALGLVPNLFRTLQFVKAFSGNEMLPGLDNPYSSNYGCHCYASWFGQLGDGRAMSIGEVTGEGGERYELQLKGCGRSPYSRGFDGRAVLRSSIREYLVSEGMFHLGVKTTRALSVVGTGQTVKRPWYPVTAKEMIICGGKKRSRFAPNMMVNEPGAILCRVSRSFLRFAQLELFAIREEYSELVQLANHVCLREFPHLLSTDKHNIATTDDALRAFTKEDLSLPGSPRRYVEMLRLVARNNAELVADWQRVGYTQGNMNSDNTLLGGRTIDYGPFGWMERYDPMYQPFTSDSDGKFAFIRQPNAMGVNIAVLAETAIVPLIRHCCEDPKGAEAEAYTAEVKAIVSSEFSRFFWKAYMDVIRRKLGLKSVQEGCPNMLLWTDLERLMTKFKVDYTIFFRELSTAASQVDCNDALMVLEPSFYEPCFARKKDPSSPSPSSPAPSTPMEVSDDQYEEEKDMEVEAWCAWLDRYLAVIKSEGRVPLERVAEQNLANPKYVLRNWMSVLAYEKAAEGDYSVVRELSELLSDPYDLLGHSAETDEKWYAKTPCWAEGMPGAEFMSCSS